MPIRRLMLTIMALVALTAVAPTPAHAASFTVTNTNDAGSGSLRQAMIDAANNPLGINSIDFSVTGTITLESALPPVTDILHILGPGASLLTVSGDDSTRILVVDRRGSLELSDVTLTKGNCLFCSGRALGNDGTTTVTRVAFTKNTAEFPAASPGGAIYNAGSADLTVTDSTFDGNSAFFGGGISNSGDLTVSGSTFSNTAGDDGAAGGGAIDTAGTASITDSTFKDQSCAVRNAGDVTVRRSTFSDNEANGCSGGAIYNVGVAVVDSSSFNNNDVTLAANLGGAIMSDGTATISNSVFTNNTGFGDGGAIYTLGRMKIENSLLYHNSAVQGGAISSGGDLEIVASTIADNRADDDGHGAGLKSFRGTINLKSSIVANNNKGPDVTSDSNEDCYAEPLGGFNDGGYNLSSDASCELSGTSLPKTDPLLASATVPAGPAWKTSLPLLSSSPAINHVPPAANGCGDVITHDIRGARRPQHGGCEIGSFEVAFPPTANDDTLTGPAPRGEKTIDVLANDTDDGVVDPDTVTIVTPPAHGTASIDSQGRIRYTAPSFIPKDKLTYDTFTYTVRGDEELTSNPATVRLNLDVTAPVISFTSAFPDGGGVGFFVRASDADWGLPYPNDDRYQPSCSDNGAPLPLEYLLSRDNKVRRGDWKASISTPADHVIACSATDIAGNTGRATTTFTIEAPKLSITDMAQTEGDADTTSYAFTVSRSGTVAGTSHAHYATADGLATSADGDYTATSGDLDFASGEASKTVEVTVNGDTKFEPAEDFSVKLSSPAGATIADGEGTGTIENDDAQPTISIDGARSLEGNAGVSAYAFTVSLSNASYQAITVSRETVDGSAAAGSDYTALNRATITFQPGGSSQQITVNVNGDTTVEPDEGFFVKLSSPTNATLAHGEAAGTILNDDLSPSASCTIMGTKSNDVLIGTAGDDVICAGRGNDRVSGLGGRDVLRGDDGNDVLLGGDDADQLLGDNGNDDLRGEGGNDKLLGGRGDDLLRGAAGSDALFGENGVDTLNTQDTVAGNDRADGGSGSDRCAFDAGDLRVSCP